MAHKRSILIRPEMDEDGYRRTIVRALKVPLLFSVDENEPESPGIVWGKGTGTAVWNGIAAGSGAGCTIATELPVDREDRRNLTPTRDVCRLTFSVEEVLLVSWEVSPIWARSGTFPSGGMDEFTTFSDLQFSEIDAMVTTASAKLSACSPLAIGPFPSRPAAPMGVHRSTPGEESSQTSSTAHP